MFKFGLKVVVESKNTTTTFRKTLNRNSVSEVEQYGNEVADALSDNEVCDVNIIITPIT